MNTRIVLAALVLAIGPNAVTAASASTGWAEQWFRAKFGHSSPQEVARQKAELENTAFREETTAGAIPSPSNWTEQYFRAKWGRDIRTGR
jgi:hypothetical protein